MLVIRRHPVTLASLLIGAIAALALVLVLDEQSKGRERDTALHRADLRISQTVGRIQRSRIEAIRISCQADQRQNNVILKLVELNIREAPRQGVVNPERIAEVRRLLGPITREQNDAVCDALLANVRRGSHQDP